MGEKDEAKFVRLVKEAGEIAACLGKENLILGLTGNTFNSSDDPLSKLSIDRIPAGRNFSVRAGQIINVKYKGERVFSVEETAPDRIGFNRFRINEYSQGEWEQEINDIYDKNIIGRTEDEGFNSLLDDIGKTGSF